MSNFSNVEKATVDLPGLGGQGVLVPGGIILTAAHCVKFRCDGGMVLGDHYIEKVGTAYGEIEASPLAIEPLSDIAALGSPDNQTFAEEALAFDAFRNVVPGIPLCVADHALFEPFPVNIYTHKKTWVKGSADQFTRDGPMLAVEFREAIEQGTSGSPIVNDAGQLVAILSNTSEADGKAIPALAPRPHRSLPVWVIERILSEE